MFSQLFRAALGVTVLTLLAAAQDAPPATQPPVQTEQPTRITVDVTRHGVAFSVIDRKGRFVTGLAQTDFQVLENGRPQSIQFFAAEPGLPLRVAVVIDTSNSIRDRFKFEQEAAVEFLNDILRTNQDKGMVVSFDSAVEMVCSLTDDTDRLGSAIRGLRPGGGTAMYDAIQFASQKLAEVQPAYNFRRIIVMVTDGDDNQSHLTRDQALETAQVDDVMIYAISTNNMGQGDTDGDKVLRFFTGQTGGKPYFPFKIEDLNNSFQTIAEEVRHQYAITYRPEPLVTDGSFRRVEISVRGHKELTVRAPSGYFAAKN